MYIKYIELCSLFEKLCTLNIQNCVYYEKLIMLNIQNGVYYLNVWILNVQTLHCLQFVEKMSTQQKIVYVEYTKLCKFFKKLFILNIQNCV